MNKLTDILNEMTDKECRSIIEEVNITHQTGTIPANSTLRTFARVITNELDIPLHNAVDLVKDYSFRRAANLWLVSLR